MSRTVAVVGGGVTLASGERVAADYGVLATGSGGYAYPVKPASDSAVAALDGLADGRLTSRTPEGRVPVTELLTVAGHKNVHAVGDTTDVAEAKMAGCAMQHAAVVAQNVSARLKGERPTATSFTGRFAEQFGPMYA
ncbi:hypothetical protein ACQB60_43325 [Actinomycetota bacterium Odt1-20B]